MAYNLPLTALVSIGNTFRVMHVLGTPLHALDSTEDMERPQYPLVVDYNISTQLCVISVSSKLRRRIQFQSQISDVDLNPRNFKNKIHFLNTRIPKLTSIETLRPVLQTFHLCFWNESTRRSDVSHHGPDVSFIQK